MNIKMKGSQTVEVSLVLPIIIFIIVCFMYFFFYLHDKVIMDSCAYYSALQSIFEENSCHTAAENNVQEVNLLTLKNISIYTEKKRNVNVSIKGKYSAPLMKMKSIMSDEYVSEDANAYQKMKLENMYVIKVVKDMLLQKEKE